MGVIHSPIKLDSNLEFWSLGRRSKHKFKPLLVDEEVVANSKTSIEETVEPGVGGTTQVQFPICRLIVCSNKPSTEAVLLLCRTANPLQVPANQVMKIEIN